ncbi:MAG: right-handed parallel beta-helix repeat-containing protein, partial [Methanosphaera sp.]|nr:right-handed parallel beta-helix repeat-containing protein [Methanosphaera sp.]
MDLYIYISGKHYTNDHRNNFTINYCSFVNNSAINGGAIYLSASSDLKINYSNFTLNSATVGGAVYSAFGGQRFYFTYCRYINNTASSYGCIYFGNNELDSSNSYTQSYFINNTALYTSYGVPESNWVKQNGKNYYENNFIIPTDFSDFFKNIITNQIIVIPTGNYSSYTIQLLKNNLTIDGNGSIVNANGMCLFDVGKNYVLSLKNMIIVNGTISVEANSLSLDNVTFINCTLPIKLTSIWDSFNTNYKISNSKFINCSKILIVGNHYNINLSNITIDGIQYTSDLFEIFSQTLSDDITIPFGYYDTLCPIVIQGDNLTINGNGSTMNSLSGQTIFYITGKNVKLTNFKFQNATSYAVVFYGYGQIVPTNGFNQTKFIGAIENITIINGGGVSFVSNGTVSNSLFNTFEGKTAINFKTNGIVSNSNFESNSQESSGHAIVVVSDVIISDSNFTNYRLIDDKGASVNVGRNADISNCNFINSVSLVGGAIYQSNPSGVVNISKSSFENCKAYSAGGAIYCEGTLIMDGNEFNNNTADNCAGFLARGLTLTNSNFTNNDATLGGAGSVDGDDTFIENCQFVDNNAVVGGGLNLQGKNGTVKDCSFINNTASAVSSALMISGDGANLVGCTVEGSSAPDGAAIKIEGNGADIKDCTFKDNTATSDGGSMLTVDGNGTTLEKVNVTGNKGNGITLNGDNATIKDNIISGNECTAITVNGKNAKVENTTVTSNNGDAIVVNGNNANFTGNTVSGNNGTAMTINGNDVVVEDTKFTGNDGDAVVIKGNGSTFKDNAIADNNGTALTIDGNGATVEKTTITGNDGKGIVVNGNGTSVKENTVSNNTGTGIVLNGNDLNITGNTLGNNSNTTGDISIGENSDMNTPEKKEELLKENTGVETFSTESDLNVIVSPKTIHDDENITLTITMATGAGTARIIFNSKEYNLTTDTVLIINPLVAGDYNITVEFTPNTGFTPVDSYVIPVHVQNWNFTELQELINNPDENGIVNLGNHTFVRQEGESPINVPS